MFRRLASRIVSLRGWRRLLLAFVAGAGTAATLAPLDLVPIAWVTIPVFVWLIDGSAGPTGRRWFRRMLPAAAIGWWFGFGYFLAGLWWIGASFLVDGDEFAWLLPVAVIALPALLALLWALGAVLARTFWTTGWSRVIVFAIAMSVAEWLRGHILTGFPWNSFGYVAMPTPLLMQVASLMGLWGVTLLAFVVFAAPVLLASGPRPEPGHRSVLAAILVAVVGDVLFGYLRLHNATSGDVPGIRLRLVQAAIPQQVKDDPDETASTFRQQIDLTTATSLAGITHVIWPETAVPYLLDEAPDAVAAIADMLPRGVSLITGAPRLIGDSVQDGASFANSMLVIDDHGEVTGIYDKIHLVPFGEYLPFRTLLESIGLRQLISLPGGFTPGTERHTLTAGDAPPFAPLICYEAIFPNAVVPPGSRPSWIVNITNDAWYGDTPGPRQHLREAAVRAVEEGLPLIRAANTGISAIIDPYGRVVASLGVNERGVVDGDLPDKLASTLYSKSRDFIPALLAAILAILAGIGRFAASRRSN